MSDPDMIARLDRLEGKLDLLMNHFGIASSQKMDAARVESKIDNLAALYTIDRAAFMKALKAQNEARSHGKRTK